MFKREVEEAVLRLALRWELMAEEVESVCFSFRGEEGFSLPAERPSQEDPIACRLRGTPDRAPPLPQSPLSSDVPVLLGLRERGLWHLVAHHSGLLEKTCLGLSDHLHTQAGLSLGSLEPDVDL